MWIYHGNGIAQAQLLWLWKQISPKCHHTRQRGGRSPARLSRPPHVLPGNFGIGRSGKCCGQTWLFILSLPPCFNFLSCSPLALRTSEQASFLKQRPPWPHCLKESGGNPYEEVVWPLHRSVPRIQQKHIASQARRQPAQGGRDQLGFLPPPAPLHAQASEPKGAVRDPIL